MARILVISSEVAAGNVGGTVSRFVLQRLGHDVVHLPTILLSHPPDQPHAAGEVIAPETLARLIAALETGQRLDFDAVLVGYLPRRAHVEIAVRTVEKLRNACGTSLTVCVDPILGDEPGGLYIAQNVARAMRETLVPLADLATPNRFELGWLSHRKLAGPEDIEQAALALGLQMVLVTSAIQNGGETGLALCHEGKIELQVHPLSAHAPRGTGDFVAALFLGHLLNGVSRSAAFTATAHAISEMTGAYAADKSEQRMRRGLPLITSQTRWASSIDLVKNPVASKR